MNDEKIVELISNGLNNKALDELYRNFPAVRKMIRANGGTNDDAHDIFQDALVIFVRKIKTGSFQLKARPGTYLFAVSRLLWKEELRKRNRRPIESFDELTDDRVEEEAISALEEDNLVRLASRALDELKDRCKELLLLFYHGGLKLKEIATRMEYSSENTAKNQKYKCLEAAKNRLKELKQTAQTF